LHAFRNDVSRPDERLRLAEYIKSQFPNLNIVINNAGIQRRIALAADNAPWVERQAEIDTLLAAPIHLNHLLIPLMLKHGRSGSIINVTSGGALVPQVFAPIYSACKAALHSYTLTLKHALNPTQQFSHGVLKLRNGDQKTAADTKRVFMTRAKFVLVAWFEIPAESMLFGWPKHEVRGNFSAG